MNRKQSLHHPEEKQQSSLSTSYISRGHQVQKKKKFFSFLKKHDMFGVDP